MMIYHFPELSRPDFGFFRGSGPGLGNLLFPIARALQAQSELGGIMVFPTMRQIKIGPFLRGERDKRTYGEIFRNRTLAETIHWVRANFSKMQYESENNSLAKAIRYSGLGRQFHDLLTCPDLICSFLKDASRFPISDEDYDVAMHVRLGDFAAPNYLATTQSTKIPIDWYQSALEATYDLLGTRKLRGILFSDEEPYKVINELKLENFIPEPSGNALVSLLLMSRCKVLIGSRSTFSLWGQYLGQTQAIWPDKFDLAQYKPLNPSKDFFV